MGEHCSPTAGLATPLPYRYVLYFYDQMGCHMSQGPRPVLYYLLVTSHKALCPLVTHEIYFAQKYLFFFGPAAPANTTNFAYAHLLSIRLSTGCHTSPSSRPLIRIGTSMSQSHGHPVWSKKYSSSVVLLPQFHRLPFIFSVYPWVINSGAARRVYTTGTGL